MIQTGKWKRSILKSTLPLLALSVMWTPTAMADSHVTPPNMNQPSRNQATLLGETPNLLATDVRPDANVVFQLDTTAKNYKNWTAHLVHSHDVSAYMYDGTTVTPLPRSDVQFDTSSGTVTVQHPMLSHYKQYAIVLEFGQKEPNRGHSSTDIITAVNASAGTVTLLGHGKVSLRDEHGHIKADDLAQLRPGAVVDVNIDRDGSQIQLDGRQQQALVALFTTGSAIGEATHVSVNLASPSVSVVSGGTLTVTAADDYGDPASNASITLNGHGNGNSRVASAFSAPKETVLTNGKATIPLTDHSAEAVTITYRVKDATYGGTVDTTSGQATETFTPGPTAAVHNDLPSTVTVGTTTHVHGDAEDAFGNAIQDGTSIAVAAKTGAISNLTSTSNGDFAFDYTAPKAKGDDALTLTAADSSYVAHTNVTVTPANAANITLTPATSDVIAGQTDVFTGTVTDTYGNVVADGTVVTLASSASSASTVVKTSGGQFTFTPTDDTKAGTFTLTARAGDSASQSASVTVTPSAPATITLTAANPSVMAGASDTFSGTVLDAYGNKVADGTAVTLTSSANLPPTQVITSNGQFVYTPTDDTQLGRYTLTASISSTLSASAAVNVTPGQTARIQLNGPTSLTVGSTGATYTGVAVDAYGNMVADGTAFTVTSQQGTVANVTTSLGGSFSFQYSAPTKTGNDVLVIQAGGSAYSMSSTVTLTAAAPASLTLNLPSGLAENTVTTDPFYAPAGYSFTGTLAGGSDSIVPAPTTAVVSGTLLDKYGNAVANTPINYAQALTGTLTTDANGNYTGTLNVNGAGAVSATVNNQSVPIVVNGVTVTSIAPTGLQLQYRTGYLGILVENGVS